MYYKPTSASLLEAIQNENLAPLTRELTAHANEDIDFSSYIFISVQFKNNMPFSSEPNSVGISANAGQVKNLINALPKQVPFGKIKLHFNTFIRATPEKFAALAPCFKDCNINAISFEECHLTVAQISAFVRSLPDDFLLESLDLKKAAIMNATPEDMAKLAQSFHNKKVKGVIFTLCDLDIKQMSAFMEALPADTSLKNINWEYNNLKNATLDEMAQFASHFRGRHMGNINLSHLNLNTTQLNQFFQSFPQDDATCIDEITLAANYPIADAEPSEFCKLAKSLEGRNIHSIDFNRASLKIEQATAFISSLSPHQVFEKISFFFNMIFSFYGNSPMEEFIVTSDKIVAFAQSFQGKHIKSIQLGNYGLNAARIASFIKELPDDCGFEKLSFSSSYELAKDKPENMKMLAQSFQDKKIGEVGFSYCGLRNEGACSLVEHWPINGPNLNLDHNEITAPLIADDSKQTFNILLKGNPPKVAPTDTTAGPAITPLLGVRKEQDAAELPSEVAVATDEELFRAAKKPRTICHGK